jgi:hypothetical protein
MRRTAAAARVIQVVLDSPVFSLGLFWDADMIVSTKNGSYPQRSLRTGRGEAAVTVRLNSGKRQGNIFSQIKRRDLDAGPRFAGGEGPAVGRPAGASVSAARTRIALGRVRGDGSCA